MGKRVDNELLNYWNDTLLLQGQVNLILSPIHELHEEYNKLLFKYRELVFLKGYQQGERLVNRKRRETGVALKAERKPVQFIKNSDELFGTLPEVEQRLRDDTFQASESTLNRVDESINSILENGYREGRGIKQVRRDIMERFDQLKDWEANRIARTEIHTAHSLGRRTAYEEMGVQYTEWISSHDKRTRRSHVLIDGEITPLNKRYSNGLMYPGDKSGPIEEWINCRCSEAPYVMSPGKMAPPGQGYFRESDLISTTEVDYNQLLLDATGGKLDYETFRKAITDTKFIPPLPLEVQNDETPVPTDIVSRILEDYNMTLEELQQLSDKELKEILSHYF